MSFRPNRKTAPRVRGGKVQRKNRTDLSPSVFLTEPGHPVIHRERPGPGFRHLCHKRDIERFLSILPDWAELSAGLRVVLLATAEDSFGWCAYGVVALCAWERELWQTLLPEFVAEHQVVYDRLGVPRETLDDGNIVCQFTEDTARAFQLLHVFLHELGHHHDRITTRRKLNISRGESYAEQYAHQYADRIFDAYVREFRLDVP